MSGEDDLSKSNGGHDRGTMVVGKVAWDGSVPVVSYSVWPVDVDARPSDVPTNKDGTNLQVCAVGVGLAVNADANITKQGKRSALTRD